MPSALIFGKCLQMFTIHTYCGCETTPYHYGKGRITELNNLFARNYPALVNVLGEGSIEHANILEAEKPFCIAQYDKLRYTAMESARFTLFAKKNTIKVIVLSPTSANLFQQVFPAHLQVMLRKAAYCLAYSDKSTDKINK